MPTEVKNETIQGKFCKMIFPKELTSNYSGFMVAIYSRQKSKEEMAVARTNKGKKDKCYETFTVVGEGLPTIPKILFEFEGSWTKRNNQPQFAATAFRQVGSLNRNSFIAQYTAPPYEGIGKTIAGRMWDVYGEKVFAALDAAEDMTVTIKGLKKPRYQKFLETYQVSRLEGCFAEECKRLELDTRQIARLFEYAKNDSEKAHDILTKTPYALCRIVGFDFQRADKYALSNGFSNDSLDRIEAGGEYILKRHFACGNICMEKKEFCKKLKKFLAITDKTRIIEGVMQGIEHNNLIVYDDAVFLPFVSKTEEDLAGKIAYRVRQHPNYYVKNVVSCIEQEEIKLGIKFAPKQVEAIKTALSNNSFVIITGGPGTGKSTIMRGALDIFQEQNPSAKIVCCAPTGKAARRLTESTGFRASTVHSALGLTAYFDGSFNEERQPLEADLVIVDEVSMLDNTVAERFFDSLQSGCRVVFVGDSDQLPSVGAGAVLYDLISSGAVPVVKLDRVYRQSGDSSIATNAAKMNSGDINLEYDSDFRFFETNSDLEKSVKRALGVYRKAVEKHGIDNVSLLCPYRTSGDVCVNRLNALAQHFINPHKEGVNELAVHHTDKELTLRVGDRVMQTRNCEGVNNGDIGVVVEIGVEDSQPYVTVDFDGVHVKCMGEKLYLLDLAYCTTVHKSQGSEYATVIICLEEAHKNLLNRSLVYTAVTRGKKEVVIVGSKKALDYAILNGNREERETKLRQRLLEA